jgi:Uncharacterized membrane protein, required for colicin V production
LVIDIIVIIIGVLAAIRGLRQGLIVGVCSFLAIIVGLAAAMKLSSVFAEKIGSAANLTGRWVPFVAFLLVFAVVALLVRSLSSIVHNVSEKLFLGIFNRLGGMVFFVLIYLTPVAILLFYITQLKLLSASYIEASFTYPFLKSLGSFTIESLGSIIPAFKNMFSALEQFFESAAHRIQEH